MKSAAVKEFWMDTDLLEKALDNCDLGDGYMAKVRQYPHKDMLSQLTHVIEYSALLEERARSEKLREKVMKHREHYGLDIFPNSETLDENSTRDSISAKMGRHMCDVFLEYIDESFTKAKGGT